MGGEGVLAAVTPRGIVACASCLEALFLRDEDSLVVVRAFGSDFLFLVEDVGFWTPAFVLAFNIFASFFIAGGSGVAFHSVTASSSSSEGSTLSMVTFFALVFDTFVTPILSDDLVFVAVAFADLVGSTTTSTGALGFLVILASSFFIGFVGFVSSTATLGATFAFLADFAPAVFFEGTATATSSAGLRPAPERVLTGMMVSRFGDLVYDGSAVGSCTRI